MRELRNLVPAEVAAVVIIAAMPVGEPVFVAMALFAAASVSRWLRRRSWSEVMHGGVARAAAGVVVGAVALALAVGAGTPAIEALGTRAVEWSTFPMVRGSGQALALFALQAGLAALVLELALRGWLVERMLELSPGPPYLPVFAGALAEALITPGDMAARTGAGLFGLGLGWMYVAGGRSALAPMCARAMFAVGAVVLEALRVVG